jgi:hypothetical protein
MFLSFICTHFQNFSHQAKILPTAGFQAGVKDESCTVPFKLAVFVRPLLIVMGLFSVHACIRP